MILERVTTTGTGLLLAVGLADLAFLNLWAFPRFLHGRGGGVNVERFREDLGLHAKTSIRVATSEATIVSVAMRPPEPPNGIEAFARGVGSAAPEPELHARAPMLLFARGHHDLEEDDEQTLAALLKALDEHRGSRLVINGHADQTGGARRNAQLSRQRAEEVAHWLTGHGIPRDRMILRAFGASRPLLAGNDEESMRRNRRVEIVLREAVAHAY